ncbi:hypothetical protein SAMN05518848_107146 [Paenibacillus sp. PDC88]|nr:hypothetical protein SAMN05518848_107146 [Paenibacillus sp. PDC88]
MFRITNIQHKESSDQIECTFTPSVQNFDIITPFMSDDCRPYQIDGGGCIWVRRGINS